MKIEADICEEDMARLWADVTWFGKYPKTLPELVLNAVAVAAERYSKAFPGSLAATVEKFRKSVSAEEFSDDQRVRLAQAIPVAFPRVDQTG